jgi:xanthine dehydrogenase accessory factor
VLDRYPRDVSRAVLSWVIEQLDAGERVAMASVIEAFGSVPGKPGAKLAISTSGKKFGTVGGAGLELRIEQNLLEMLSKSKSQMRKTGGKIETYLLYKDGKGKEVVALDSLCGGQLKVSLEVIEPVPHILIAGGGHVGKSVSIVCDTLGWQHSVFDIRSEFSNQQRFPTATEIVSCSVADFLKREKSSSLSRFSDVLVLGHDWSVDQELLIGLLRDSPDNLRIGVIGSKSKWKGFVEAAEESGIGKDGLSNARCPIGLEIGADSPEEIAVAICAEILSMERGA